MSEKQVVYVLEVNQSRDESSVSGICGIFSSEEKAFKCLEEQFLKNTQCTELEFKSLIEKFKIENDFQVFDSFYHENKKEKEYYCDLSFRIFNVEIDEHY